MTLNETQMSNNDNAIELSHSYVDIVGSDRANVTETVTITDEQVEATMEKLIFCYGPQSKNSRWEIVKNHAEGVKIERTVFRDD